MSRVAILGAGNAAFATAAIAGSRGHDVTVWSPSGRSTLGLATQPILEYSGALTGQCAVRVARSVQDVADADVFVIAVPGYAVRAVIDAMTPVVSSIARSDAWIVLTPALSCGPLVLAAQARSARVIALGTTVATSRRAGDRGVTIFSVRESVDCAAVPAAHIDSAIALVTDLFGLHFMPQSSVLATALANPNPVFHVPLVLANLTRIGRGESWTQYDSMTTPVAAIAEQIDTERLAVARAFGIQVRSIHEHFVASFGVPMGPLAEQSRAVHDRLGSPAGPTSLDHRYLTEDVPYGLAFASELGRIAGVATPITDSCIELASVASGRDLRAADDLFATIAPADRSLARLAALAQQ